MMLQSMARKFRSMRDQSAFTLVWLFPAWLLLGIYRALILTLPLKRMAPFYGEDIGVATWIPLAGPDDIRRAMDIRSTVAIASRYCPWTANCYPKALAARSLLRLYRVPHAIYFGLAREPATGDLAAHAWVMAGPVAVSGGGASFGRYRVVRMFLDQASAPAPGKAV